LGKGKSSRALPFGREERRRDDRPRAGDLSKKGQTVSHYSPDLGRTTRRRTENEGTRSASEVAPSRFLSEELQQRKQERRAFGLADKEERYHTILEVLSATKKAKEFLHEENAMNAAALEAVIEAERVLVAMLLEGKKLVAFSEPELEAVQNASE
jgi:hypothetical protein